jgi:hypothetical protein
VSARTALSCGTVLSLAAVSTWSWTADLTIRPPASLVLSRNLPGDYVRLADAPTGNGWELFTVVAVIDALCRLASGWRHQRRRTDGGG